MLADVGEHGGLQEPDDVLARCNVSAETCRADINLRNLDPGLLGLPDLEIEQIPDGAAVIDLRTLAEFKTWHVDDALHLEFGTALHASPNFDPSQTYVLYCEIGLKSAHLAELMRAQGLTAYHVPGGLRTLKRD